MGAIGTRLSLRPLFKKRANEMQSSGKSCRENAKLRPIHTYHRPACAQSRTCQARRSFSGGGKPGDDTEGWLFDHRSRI
jgi:hypothetical protein